MIFKSLNILKTEIFCKFRPKPFKKYNRPDKDDIENKNIICYIIVIPWVISLYVEIIHELYRVGYLTFRWTNMVELFYTTYISVDLAHHEIFHAKVGKGGIIGIIGINRLSYSSLAYMLLDKGKQSKVSAVENTDTTIIHLKMDSINIDKGGKVHYAK